MAAVLLDPIARAHELRKTVLSPEGVLVVDFSNTLQGKDTSRIVDLMPNGAGRFVFRTKVNVKTIDPFATAEYGKPYTDIGRLTTDEIEDFLRKQEFDFPLWFKHHPDFNMHHVMDYNLPIILQVAGCNFHDGTKTGGCRYCFVDNESNDGLPGAGKTYVSVADVVASALRARGIIHEKYATVGREMSPRVLRISGGEPTIALDWICELWEEVARRGLDFVGQIDTNLSTPGLWPSAMYERLAKHPVKVLVAIKGTDEIGLRENVQAAATLAGQLECLRTILAAGLDIFPQMYNPNPDTLTEYLAKMDASIENFSLRVHLGPLNTYGPTSCRLACEAEKLGLVPGAHIFLTETKWRNNYIRGREVLDAYLRAKYGIGYQEKTRADIKLTLR